MDGVDELIEQAVAAAAAGDSSRFEEAVRSLEQGGWSAAEVVVAEKFVDRVSYVLGDEPTVNDIVNLAQALHRRTSSFMGATVFDLEFLIRGHAGATALGESIPRNVAITMQLAVLGVVDQADDFRLGDKAFD